MRIVLLIRATLKVWHFGSTKECHKIFFLIFFSAIVFWAWVLIGLLYQLSCILNQMSLLNILEASLDLKPYPHKFNCCSMDLAPSWPKEKPWVRAGHLGSSSLTGMATGNQSASFPHLTNSWDVSFLLRDFLFICSELVLSSTGLKIHDSFQKKKKSTSWSERFIGKFEQ